MLFERNKCWASKKSHEDSKVPFDWDRQHTWNDISEEAENQWVNNTQHQKLDGTSNKDNNAAIIVINTTTVIVAAAVIIAVTTATFAAVIIAATATFAAIIIVANAVAIIIIANAVAINNVANAVAITAIVAAAIAAIVATYTSSRSSTCNDSSTKNEPTPFLPICEISKEL